MFKVVSYNGRVFSSKTIEEARNKAREILSFAVDKGWVEIKKGERLIERDANGHMTSRYVDVVK